MTAPPAEAAAPPAAASARILLPTASIFNRLDLFGRKGLAVRQENDPTDAAVRAPVS
jgi:hypothetical protein